MSDIFWVGLELRSMNIRLIVRLTHYHPAMPFGNKKKVFYRIFSAQYRHNLKKYYPSENQKFYHLGIFKSLKLRIGMEKIP